MRSTPSKYRLPRGAAEQPLIIHLRALHAKSLTVDLLSATGVGKVVASLRKHRVGEGERHGRCFGEGRKAPSDGAEGRDCLRRMLVPTTMAFDTATAANAPEGHEPDLLRGTAPVFSRPWPLQRRIIIRASEATRGAVIQ